MPSWGRPPGAKGSRRRQRWQQEQAHWEEHARVEELDSDDDTDTQGVGLNFTEKRFSSDPLQFTGIDLSSGARSRRQYTYDETDSSDESSDDSDEEEEDGAFQVALRDKEEALVQSALARIRRAQQKGKREVKLNQDELDALEKRRKRMQSAATANNSRTRSGSGSGSERRRHSDRQVVSLPLAGEPISRKSKSRRPAEVLAGPGMIVPGADGPTFAPLGYYPSQATSTGRPRSATNRELRGTPPPQYAFQQGLPNRHFSDTARPTSSSSSGSRRPMPDEEDWVPANSRRTSVSSQSSRDPFQYQTSSGHPPPIPAQYMQPSTSSRRNGSGPPEVTYSSVHRSPPLVGYSSTSRGAASDPSLTHRRSKEVPDSQESSSDEDHSDDLGNGAQVFVEREPEKERAVPSRKPVGGRRKKGR